MTASLNLSFITLTGYSLIQVINSSINMRTEQNTIYDKY